jgi:predicted transposase YdaD
MEHQSSLNPNMAIRLLFYAASVYKGLIDNSALYSSKKALLPRPEFFVLYNGEDELEDKTTLKLSDSFEQVEGRESTNSLELEVQVININLGHNEEMLLRSEYLSGYSIIVDKIREYTGQVSGLSYEERRIVLSRAIRKTLEYCVEHNILEGFIKENGVEVMNMLSAEFDINVAERIWKEEAMERGIEKGRREGMEKGMERGREVGRKEGKEEFLSLIRQGYTLEQLEKSLSQPLN